MAKPVIALPDETQRRLRVLVQRSSPNLERPRLAIEHELAFADADRASAACYASAEDLSHRLRQAAARTDEFVRRVWPPDEE